MQGVPATMAAADLVDLSGLMDDAKCFAFVRQRRWPEGVRCPGCGSALMMLRLIAMFHSLPRRRPGTRRGRQPVSNAGRYGIIAAPGCPKPAAACP